MWLIVKQILHGLHRALCEVMVVYSAQSKTKWLRMFGSVRDRSFITAGGTGCGTKQERWAGEISPL